MGGGHATDQPHPVKREPGRVLVLVPRSFYLNADIRPDNREPTLDEFRSMKDRTENQIRTAIGLVTPSSELWKVDIFTIPDEVSPRPVILQSAVDAQAPSTGLGNCRHRCRGGLDPRRVRVVGSGGATARAGNATSSFKAGAITWIRRRNQVRRSVCASWCGAIPKRPPVSFNAGPGREAARDDDNPPRNSLATNDLAIVRRA